VKNAYVDASALVKLVLPERGTPELYAYLGGIAALLTSEIAEIEAGRAVRAATADRGRLEAMNEWLARATIVELDAELRARAAQVTPAALRTLDAVHLATAARVADLVNELVTYDRRLAAAARQAGLRVVSPGADE
jgi:predicted nucleic acid-binding protein